MSLGPQVRESSSRGRPPVFRLLLCPTWLGRLQRVAGGGFSERDPLRIQNDGFQATRADVDSQDVGHCSRLVNADLRAARAELSQRRGELSHPGHVLDQITKHAPY